MNYEQFLKGILFRFADPRAARDDEGWYSLSRPDGSRARLLGLPGFPLDLFNGALPQNEPQIRATLRELCSIPKMSTFAIGAIVNQAVAQMASDRSFVNIGVWNGFTFLCGLTGNPDRACVGIDNFSQFGGPREDFLARFDARKSPRHQFHDMDYAEYFARVHQGLIGVYIYDGEHSYENQLKGLQAAEPFFAEDCIIVVDDTNWLDPWQANMDFVARSPQGYRLLLDQTTCQNGHPSFWNGVMVLQRSGRSKNPAGGIVSSAEFRRSEKTEPNLPKAAWRHAIAPEQRRMASLVSIVMVHSNAQANLDAALASALSLTYPNTEIIVVDDTGSDGGRDIIQDNTGRLTKIRSHGRGDNASHGKWVCFMDSERPLVASAVEVALNFGLDALGCAHSQTDWYDRAARALIELTQLVPPEQTIILVDDAQLGIADTVIGRRVLPFLERNGQYNGQPANDNAAIHELQRLQGMGASHIAFAWPSFWWLEQYPAFHRHLRQRSRCVVENERLLAFDLGG